MIIELRIVFRTIALYDPLETAERRVAISRSYATRIHEMQGPIDQDFAHITSAYCGLIDS